MLWLSVDPGEMTGWALWEDRELIDADQTELIRFIDDVWFGIGQDYCKDPSVSGGPFRGVKRLVVEEFRLYPWVVKEGGLDFDELRTSRGIGQLEFIARHANLEFKFQPATIKETAIMGGARELFQHPLYENRHANDAVMHGWYFVVTEMLGTRVELPHASVVAVDPSKLRSPEA
jgi:hypothetical protein